ncbi:hypothetical protein [Nostoc favosum]|uniref:Uncharacterized protein n=1 Tax=Nostoc favosum CHAB5714 TaxID=2780399 RepID=A0ABS8I510_9NOSO|nr:hypothetical protein [Nostoc favosum]MCC5599061.1 hypothetical protein [Nostoc favosum CHAB5714]
MKLLANMFKGMLKRPNILIVFLIFISLVAYIGYEIGRTNRVTSSTILTYISIFLGLTTGGVNLLNYFIDWQIKTETEEEKERLKQQYDSNQLAEKHRMDFISLVSEEITFEKIDESLLRKKENPKQFKSRIRDNLERIKNSQQALNGLLSSRKKNGINVNLLDTITFTALKRIGIPIETSADEKFIHLYAYLKAWLICGIRHDTTNLPIEWIDENALNQQEQIRALEYIKDKLINHEKVIEEIPKEESRKIIREYLEELINKIKAHQQNQAINSPNK